MPSTSRTFRIFVSSTFSDLKAERNALQQYVFPRLRELALAHGCRFQAIDLRWGVSEEAALDQQTMKICLGEIERCQKVTPRPNFVILLGDRFGWRPLPYAIPVQEFEMLAAVIGREDHRANQPSTLHLIQQWYRLDDNAVPAEYVLQPRQKGTLYADYTTWESQVERPLVDALEQAARQVGLDEDALVKYTQSATGQEIAQGALKVVDAKEHVFGFFRRIENTETLRKDENTEFLDADPLLGERQQTLKEQLRERLPGNTHEYQARWDGKALSTDHIGDLTETLEECLKLIESSQAPQTLCQAAWLRLSQVILTQVAQFEILDALQREIQAHAEFGQERARFFTGREEPLQQIARYLDSPVTRPLGVWGESGAGKSALMARTSQQAEARTNRNPVVIVRFIGSTPDSTNIRALLDGLCHELTRAYGGDESAIPVTYPELVGEFPKRLELASAEHPAWLFLDALDQLSPADNAHLLAWLPSGLPANTKIIVSTLPGECKQSLERLGALELPLSGLQTEEGAALLDQWLGTARRCLTGVQRIDLLAKFNAGGGLPLYLKLAFEEARRWHSYDGLPAMSDHEPGLSNDIPGVIRDLFFRLSQESQHGEKLVGRALGYLAAGKNGLTEDELLEVLWQDEAVKEDFRRRSPRSPQEVPALPVAVWARLYQDLEPYLIERSADGTHTLGFYHRQLGEAVAEKYLEGRAQAERHRSLAIYFAAQPLQRTTREGETYNLRKLSELPYQQAGGGLWEELKATLLDYAFLYGKTKAIGINALVGDYDLLQPSNFPFPPGDGTGVRVLQRTLRQVSHMLVQDPDQFPSQLWGRLCVRQVTEYENRDTDFHSQSALSRMVNYVKEKIGRIPSQQSKLLSDRKQFEIESLLQQAIQEHPEPWLRPIIPSLDEGDALACTFAEHNNWVIGCVVTPDGRQVISASFDHTLKLWDLSSGTCLRTFEGHTDRVKAFALTPDGRKVVSASSDKTLKLWDLASGACLRTFNEHTCEVYAFVLTPDGRQVVSASYGDTIKIWDLASGACLHTFEGEFFALTPDGRQVVSVSDSSNETLKLRDHSSDGCLRTSVGHTDITDITEKIHAVTDRRQVVSASCDKTLKLWDLSSGACLRTFVGHTDIGEKIYALTPDGRQVVSASPRGTLKLWDLWSGACLRTFEGHMKEVWACAVTPDGRQVISASGDQTLKLWDLSSGACLRTFAGHTARVSAFTLTPDGRQVVSASDDHTIKLWDLASGDCLRTFSGHNDWVVACALTPNGRQVISASHDKTLKLWNFSSNVRISGADRLRTFAGHTGCVNAFALTPDGRQVVSASHDKTLKLWDLSSGACLRTFEGHTDRVNACALTPDGRQVVSASYDGTIKLWDLASGVCLRTFKEHTSAVIGCALTPDGRQVVSASCDKTLKLWGLSSGACLRTYEVGKWPLHAFALTPDGRQAISVEFVYPKLWDLTTSACLRTFEGHKDTVKACAVTPDGRQFVSASEDKTLKLWDIASGACLRTFEGHTHWVSACAVTPDGRQIVSASLDYTLKLWELETGALQVTFVADGPLRACAVARDGRTFVSHGASGRLHILRLEGMPSTNGTTNNRITG